MIATRLRDKRKYYSTGCILYYYPSECLDMSELIIKFPFSRQNYETWIGSGNGSIFSPLNQLDADWDTIKKAMMVDLLGNTAGKFRSGYPRSPSAISN